MVGMDVLHLTQRKGGCQMRVVAPRELLCWTAIVCRAVEIACAEAESVRLWLQMFADLSLLHAVYMLRIDAPTRHWFLGVSRNACLVCFLGK